MTLTPKPRAIEQLPSSADALAGRTSSSHPGEGTRHAAHAAPEVAAQAVASGLLPTFLPVSN